MKIDFAKAVGKINLMNVVNNSTVWKYSLETVKNLKESFFALGIICTSQLLPLDMFIYYDARTHGMNGQFSFDVSLSPLKTYYVYNDFADLRELGERVAIDSEGEDRYAVAVTNGNESAVLLSFHIDDIKNGEKNLCIEIERANSCGRCVRAVFLCRERIGDLVFQYLCYFPPSFLSLISV